MLMGFVDPSKREDGGGLAGSGLRVDLDTKVCPACRREALPWEATCPDCGVAAVAPSDVPATSFPLPHLDLGHLDADEPDADAADPDAG
jgi:rubredoxin